MNRRWMLAATLSAAACASAPPPAPVVVPVKFEKQLAAILRLEDERVLRDPAPPPAPVAPVPQRGRAAAAPAPPPPPPDLIAMLGDPQGRVRRRAALAVGRVGLAEGVAPLSALLGDGDAEVRSMAAFALGLIGDRAAIPALRTALSDADVRVRGRAAESLGRLNDTESAAAIGELLRATVESGAMARAVSADPNAAVPADVETARLALYSLVRLKAWEPMATAVLEPQGEPRVRWWPVAYALQRIEDKRAAPALLSLLRGPDVETVAFAARGLGALKEGTAVEPLLALADAPGQDVRVVAQAIRSLGQIGDARAVGKLGDLARRRDIDDNVRLEAVTALGGLSSDAAIEPLLDLATSRSVYVRGASLRALAATNPVMFITTLSTLDADPAWSARADLAAALGGIDREIAQARLTPMLDDQDQRVIAAVLDSLVRVGAADVDRVLVERLTADDVVVRATAARLLGERKVASAAPALQAAYRAAKADETYIARAATLVALTSLGAPAATDSLKDALQDKDWAVRRRAAELLVSLDPSADTRAIHPAPTGHDRAFYDTPSLLAPSYSPQVYIETAKGTIQIELNVLDAPLTAYNFVTLARRGFFNGVVIHRVVANFVVQDGDPRGDGEGGPGYTIRDEINDVPYLRGTVGMALDWADTGGSQFFITHAPQPHLDGRYTVFGRVVDGMEIVDRLVKGDVIERVRVWDGVEFTSAPAVDRTK